MNKLGFVFQTFNLLSSLTALENVEMPMILNGSLTPSQRRKRAIYLLEKVGMGKRLDHVPSQLSGGEQQRVTIARAVANQPDILLLDEPTGDLDSMNTVLAMKLLTDLNKLEGITLVMVTHDVGLKFFADRIIWMRDGKISRVEVVSEHKKSEVYAQLAEDVRALDGGGGSGGGGDKDDSGSGEMWSKTTLRSAASYSMLQGQANKDRDLKYMANVQTNNSSDFNPSQTSQLQKGLIDNTSKTSLLV